MNYHVVGLSSVLNQKGKCVMSACSKAVFAHYMVGTVEPEHVQQNVRDAAAICLDGFALNVEDSAQSFVSDFLAASFDYTRDNFPNLH